MRIDQLLEKAENSDLYDLSVKLLYSIGNTQFLASVEDRRIAVFEVLDESGDITRIQFHSEALVKDYKLFEELLDG